MPARLVPITPPAALRDELPERGWIERQNLVIERHGDDGHSDRVVILAAELVRMKLDVIVTFGAVAGVAIKKAHGVLLFQWFTDFNVRPGLIALIA